jgi:uncharacterized protein (TIGR02594 family)
MKLPTQYQWLEKIEVLPNNIANALEFFGVQEVVGKGSNKTIISWRDLLNQAGVTIAGYSDDDIPWCGLFVAIVVFFRKDNPLEVVKSPLWARNWLNYGVKASTPALGDVLVFGRDGGGHVGFYIGEDALCYHVLGGNQSNKVCITRIAKSRCLGIRRPTYNVQPESAKRYFLASTGGVSKNEA